MTFCAIVPILSSMESVVFCKAAMAVFWEAKSCVMAVMSAGSTVPWSVVTKRGCSLFFL